MISSRLISIIRKEFIQIWRDPRSLVLIFLMPIIQLILLGYAATNDVRNIPMGVFDQDRGPEARALLDAFRSAKYFNIAFDVNSEEELRSLVDNGKARVGLIIPPGYTREIQTGGNSSVVFVLDGSDPSVAATALSTAQLIGQSLSTAMIEERLEKLTGMAEIPSPIEVRTRVWYNPDLVSSHFMVPGVIGMILYAITSILTATSVVRERERGTMEQLIVTPIRPWELVVGKMLPYAILAFINTFEVLAFGAWWFDVPIRGDLGLITLLSGLFILSGLGIGLFASTIANTQQEAMLTVWLTLLPSVFLGGFLFPIEAMPKAIQLLSYLMPLRYYLVIIRSLLLKGVGAGALVEEIVALALFGVIIMGFAVLRFRKRLE